MARPRRHRALRREELPGLEDPGRADENHEPGRFTDRHGRSDQRLLKDGDTVYVSRHDSSGRATSSGGPRKDRAPTDVKLLSLTRFHKLPTNASAFASTPRASSKRSREGALGGRRSGTRARVPVDRAVLQLAVDRAPGVRL